MIKDTWYFDIETILPEYYDNPLILAYRMPVPFIVAKNKIFFY